MFLDLEQLERDQIARANRGRPDIKSDKANRLMGGEFCMFEYVEEICDVEVLSISVVGEGLRGSTTPMTS